MSYREMRNFTETMRALGFPRLISMENFRTPNFKLVAEILCWLAYRFDSNADIPLAIDSEQDRVIFIKLVAQFMLNKAHVRLNTKKLYQADGYAVKEMLKLTTLLYQATKRTDGGDEENENGNNVGVLDAAKVRELSDARQLASQITTKGAVLYDLFGQEVDLREERRLALGRNMDLQDMEAGVKGAIRSVEEAIRKIQGNLENVAADEANLEAKIEKKRNEVERNKKRLSTLQSVRPAYMDEYEQLEEELQHLYSEYLVKYRNLAFLENMYEEFVNVEIQRDQMELLGSSGKMEQMIRESANVSASAGGGASGKGRKLSADEDELGGLLDGDDDEEDSDGASSSSTEESPQNQKEAMMRSAHAAAMARRQMNMNAGGAGGGGGAGAGGRAGGPSFGNMGDEDDEDSMDSVEVDDEDDNDSQEDSDEDVDDNDSDDIVMGPGDPRGGASGGITGKRPTAAATGNRRAAAGGGGGGAPGGRLEGSHLDASDDDF